MKILYHHRTLSQDGMSVHINELIAALRRRRHEVIVVGPAPHDATDFGSGGELTNIVRRLIPGFAVELLELVYDRLAYRRLAKAYLLHKPDILYERYNLFLMAGRTLSRKFNLPFLLEVNAPLVLERREHGGLSWQALAAKCERDIWRAADAVLPVTRPLADLVAAVGVSEMKIHVIGNGINANVFHRNVDGTAVRQRYGLHGKLVLGFTGFMRAWHSLDRVVKFLADNRQQKNLHFLVVGDGPARPDLENKAAELGVADQVTLTGVVERNSIAAHVAAFDIALQPSSVPYASPLKLLEYMALGCAILAPDQPNIREILKHDDSAFLFDSEDANAFAQALKVMCADAELRRRLGARAAEVITTLDLTWDGNARRIEEIAQQVVCAQRAAVLAS